MQRFGICGLSSGPPRFRIFAAGKESLSTSAILTLSLSARKKTADDLSSVFQAIRAQRSYGNPSVKSRRGSAVLSDPGGILFQELKEEDASGWHVYCGVNPRIRGGAGKSGLTRIVALHYDASGMELTGKFDQKGRLIFNVDKNRQDELSPLDHPYGCSLLLFPP